MASTQKFNDAKSKIFIVLYAIKSASELAPKGHSILLHPRNDMLKNIHIIDLDNVLLKLEKDYKVIKLLKNSELSPRFKSFVELEIERPTQDFRESYEIDISKGFDGLFETTRNEIGEKIKENPKVQSIDTQDKRKPSNNLLWITYSDKTSGLPPVL